MKTFREYVEERESLDEGLLASAAPLMLAAMAPDQSSREQYDKLHAEIQAMFQRSAEAEEMAKKVQAAVNTMDTPGSREFLNKPETKLFLLYNPQFDPSGPPQGASGRANWEADRRIEADKHWKAADFRELLRKSIIDDGKMLKANLDSKGGISGIKNSGIKKPAENPAEKPRETILGTAPSLRDLMRQSIRGEEIRR